MPEQMALGFNWMVGGGWIPPQGRILNCMGYLIFFIVIIFESKYSEVIEQFTD